MQVVRLGIKPLVLVEKGIENKVDEVLTTTKLAINKIFETSLENEEMVAKLVYEEDEIKDEVPTVLLEDEVSFLTQNAVSFI